MHKNTIVYIIWSLVIVGVFGIGIFISQKKSAPADQSNVSVDSTGGTLKVTELPVNQYSTENPTVTPKPEEKPATNTSTNSSTQTKTMNKVTLDTNFGKIVLEMYPADAPKTVQNFLTLAQKGFYNGVIFHRVIPGFMIQGGDPMGTGTGGPGYKFDDELNPSTPSYKAGYKKGVLAMANAGPNTNGSQFFIMLADYPLPNNYTIFGHVVVGQDVVDAIGKTPTDESDRPLSEVVMKSVTVSN
ncbi:MAG: peptidylprolyl isomerase [Patescibacteria group bacterium]